MTTPTELPSRPEWYDLLRAYATESIACVGDEIRIADAEGFWHPLAIRPGTPGAVVLTEMATGAAIRWFSEHDPDYESGTEVKLKPSHIPALANEILAWLYDAKRRKRAGVAQLTAADFDNPDYIPLASGGVMSLKDGGVWQGRDAIRKLRLTRREGPGMVYRRELLTEPPHAVTDLVQHYGGLGIFRRLAYAFAHAPSKRIDTYVSALPDSGKDTLAVWLRRAGGGEIIVKPAMDYVKSGGQRFTVLARDLCSYRIAIANECDKPDSIPAGFLTHITSDQLSDERKGVDPVLRTRRGDLLFVGNGPPKVESGPGVDARLQWAYQAQWPVMPSELRHAAVSDPDVSAWLGTYLLDIAMSVHHGALFDWAAGHIAAADMRAEAEPEETDILRQSGLIAAGPRDYVTAASIRDALANGGVEVSRTANFAAFLTPISPRCKRAQFGARGQQAWGYRCLAWQSP